MFGTRRLAKRSIVGTRVAAQWQDGRYYSGVIQDSNPTHDGRHFYSVTFDDGYTRQVFETDIIGPGFQTINTATLKKGQKVFITHSGREIFGTVIKHNKPEDSVIIAARMPDQPFEQELIRRLDEIRLLESRKSARLEDRDTNYSKMADLSFHRESEARKRTVSQGIDVPAKHSRGRTSMTSEGEELMDEDDEDVGMDEHMAAMVLTSLSCSPVSPKFPIPPSERGDHFPASPRSFNDSFLSSSYNSGYQSNKSGSPSPPAPVSGSAPSGTVFGTSPIDEGIVVDDTSAFFEDSSPRKRKISTRTVFKCTWPGCAKIHNTCNAIEQHVRDWHLGPKEKDPDYSDHEEEFYYTEMDITMDHMTETFAQNLYTSSPPEREGMHLAVRPMHDHDYQKKESKVFTPEDGPATADFEPMTIPINIPQLSKSLSWQSPHSASAPSGSGLSSSAKIIRPSPQDRLHSHQAQSPKSYHLFGTPPKTSPTHKKMRSDVKKCRKVYGMENRDMWCTQCKWKKACSRFTE